MRAKWLPVFLWVVFACSSPALPIEIGLEPCRVDSGCDVCTDRLVALLFIASSLPEESPPALLLALTAEPRSLQVLDSYPDQEVPDPARVQVPPSTDVLITVSAQRQKVIEPSGRPVEPDLLQVRTGSGTP